MSTHPLSDFQSVLYKIKPWWTSEEMATVLDALEDYAQSRIDYALEEHIRNG